MSGAVRRIPAAVRPIDLARALGGFEPRLGRGAAACGGEELDFHIRLVHSGASIAYEPAGKTGAYPPRLDTLERAGMLAGPAAFALSAATASARRGFR
jgi:hypothetical protein